MCWAERRAAYVALALAAFALTACAGDAVEAKPTPTSPPPTTTATATVPAVVIAGDPTLAVMSLVQACRAKDAEDLRALVAGVVPDAELQALFARGDDVRLLRHSVPDEPGGRAQVTVLLRIQRATGVDEVERTWELEQSEEGVWRFTDLPECY